ncbi:MAG TPA: hypothetical protein VJ483_05645 [Holophagaceae bacterium]|nr:hypothetical protein [Holophagaceae bacterium]
MKTLRLLLPFLAAAALPAWSPRVHEVQTAKAVKMLPKNLADLLRSQPQVLLDAAKGKANDQPPTVEEVDSQYRTILRLSLEEGGVRAEDLVREMGTLAHMVQALQDPSCTSGVTPVREAFEAYADEKLGKLVVTRERFWALSGPTDPKPVLQHWMAQKMERNRTLASSVDPAGKRVGPWDDLSIPFAQLQLSFSNGVNATANVWILLYREVGQLWPYPSPGNRTANLD